MARPRREGAAQRLILDAGAVIALSRGERRARGYLARALELGAEVEVPVVVVAETVRGGPRGAAVHRVLEAVAHVPPAQEQHGRIAGELLGRAGVSHTVDALVVAQAIAGGGGVVLTGDREDLQRLALAHPEVHVAPL